jgi:hypothetical protein
MPDSNVKPPRVLVCAVDPAPEGPGKIVKASMLVDPHQVGQAREVMGVVSPVIQEVDLSHVFPES